MTRDYDTWLRWIDGTTPWQDRYPEIAEHVREVVRQSGPLDSTSLVKRMLAHLTKDQRDALTKRVHDILKPISKHDLKDWWSLSSKLKRGYAGRLTASRIWEAPQHTGAGGVTRPCSNPVDRIPGLGASTGKCWRTMSLWETRLMLSEPHHPFHARHHVNFRAMMEVIHEIEEGKPAPWLEPDDDLSDLTGE